MHRLTLIASAVLLCGCGARVPPAAALAIDPPEGMVALGADGIAAAIEVRFRLTNAGGRPITIKRVETPCCQGGVKVVEPTPKSRLQPGESTELILAATPPSVGHYEKVVRVETDLPDSPTPIPIKFAGAKLNPPYMIGLKPDDLHFTGAEPAAFVEREMRLCAVENDASEPWIEGLVCSVPSITAMRVGEPTVQPVDTGVVMRCYTYRVRAQIPEAGEAPVAAALDIKVAAPSQQPVYGCLVRTALVPAVRALPATLSIPYRAMGDLPVARKLLLLSNSGKALGPVDIGPLPDWLKVAEDAESSNVPSGAKRFVVALRRAPPQDDAPEALVEFRVHVLDSLTTVNLPVRVELQAGVVSAPSQ
jgi:hypothetical protein